jgi:hypothetical protein
VGLGGRNRRAASASERARQSITKSIKSVLERIAQSDATLGDLLSRCIKTGTFCSYHPDPDFPFAWEFAETNTEPTEQPPPRGDPVAARADHRPLSPVILDVSPFSLAERTAFAGRETEGALIRAMIDRALSGHGSLVMLGGGPGVGKSRLAMEMTEYASRVGFKCLVGHCYERDESFPYLPFVELIESSLAQAASLDDFRRRLGDNAAELAQLAPSLRRVFPDIPQPLELPEAQKRRYFFQSISEALGREARTRPYVYILEDLHWADESTLAFLIHLAQRVTQLPVVIIGTYRDGVSDGKPALIRALEELIRLGILSTSFFPTRLLPSLRRDTGLAIPRDCTGSDLALGGVATSLCYSLYGLGGTRSATPQLLPSLGLIREDTRGFELSVSFWAFALRKWLGKAAIERPSKSTIKLDI